MINLFWMPSVLNLIRFACVALTLLLVTAMGSFAQQNGLSEVDYTRWDSVAARAQTAIDADAADNETFEILNERIKDFRTRFDAARNANTSRIATLRQEIAALGPAPEAGDTEPDDIAASRANLNAQLAELEAPTRRAEAAFLRADGLVDEISDILRKRETARLLERGAIPVNPVYWPGAVQDLTNALAGVVTQARKDLGDTLTSQEFRDQAPIVVLLFVLGLTLLMRGRRWATRLGDRLELSGARSAEVLGFVVSLLRILLPLAGLFLLVSSIEVGPRWGTVMSDLLERVFVWVLAILGLRWLAERLFSRNDQEAILPLPPQRRSEARFYVLIMSLLLVLDDFVLMLLDHFDFSQTSEAVVFLPLVVAMGLILFRFGQLMRSAAMRAEEEEGDTTEEGAQRIGAGLTSTIRLLGLAVMIAAVAAPLMVAMGYTNAGTQFLFPTLQSLAILGLVLVLQRFFADVYGWISGQGIQARDSLVAILIGFFLLVLSAPFLALTWGTREAELRELWVGFLRGFQLGDATISPTDFLTFAVVFAMIYVLTRLLQGALKNSVLPKTKIDIGGQNAIVSGLGYVGIFLAALMAITAAGIDLSSLAIVAGALSVGIGFGLQNIVSNFVSGIILLIERPISEGDWIEVGGQMGYVRDISVRSTRIETFDRSDVIVPNADLVSGTVTNFTRGNTVGRVIVPVGVAYGTDTRMVERILKDVAESHPMVVLNPPPSVVFQGFGASSLDFEIRAILRDVNWMLSVKSEMNHQIAERFVAEGIEIPFPQQDVWLRNPQDLRKSPEPPESDASDTPPEEVQSQGDTP